MWRACFAGLVIFATANAAIAQSTATISGTVMDQTGAVLPGVEVTVRNTGTALTRTVITSERGDYVIPLLPVGAYEVTAALPGFRTEVRPGIVLQVDQRLSLSFNLQVGEVTERLLVTEAPPLVDAETSSVGTVIENRRVVELPLNGREFQSLAALVAGAQSASPRSGERSYGEFQMAGTRRSSTAVQLDGMDILDGLVSRPSFKPSVDMIQEFKVQVSTFSAEHGRSPGGHVQMTTKSGTNKFHGTLYEFVRNHIFDAKNFFDPPNEPIPPFKRNNFGGTIGGPINHDRTFFFFSYEALRLRQALTRTATVPLPEMINGDFSSLGGPIRDPFTGQPFPGNVIPANRINRVGLNIARLFPAPNQPGSVRNYVSSPTDRRTIDQYSGRIDHRLSDHNNLYGRYTVTDDTELDPFDSFGGISKLPGYGRTEDQLTQNISVADTHVFTPSLLGEFRAGYNRYYEVRSQENSEFGIPAKLGIPGVTTKDPRATGIPPFRVTGYETIGKSQYPSYRMSSTYQGNVSITYTHAEHTIKFGGEMIRFANPNSNNGGSLGDFTFDGGYTGNGLADLLLGFPRRTSITRGDSRNVYYRNTFAGFVQDDWKVTSRLTLNLGLRYDLLTPIVSAADRMSIFNPQTGAIEIAGNADVRRDISRPDQNLGGPEYDPGLAALAQNVKLVDLGRRNIHKHDHNDFAPRVGLAYRLLGNDRLVFRTGYGIFYSFIDINSGGLRIGRNYPFRVAQTFNANATVPNISIENAFPVGLGAATISPVSGREDYRTGYVHHYNLGFQYQPLPDFVIDLSYVGNKSTKLSLSRNLNQVLPGPGSIASRRPYQGFGNINYSEPADNGHFDSLQLSVQRRYGGGLTLLTAYTWGKSFNTVDVQGTRQKGVTDLDIRHRLVLSYIYELPLGSGQRLLGNASGIGNWLVSGWQFSGITTFQSGLPVPITTSRDISNTGGGDRPNLVGDPKLPRSNRNVDGWFNTAAFQLPQAGTFGNVGRDAVIAPGLHNWDVSLVKNMRLAEAKNLQFRAEVFNIANHPQFDFPNGDISSTQFGKIFATTQFSRQIQLGLKFIY
ncbi:MAG: TonB-dependent receptor [Acidobacteria bacterium]|nr:TonB-dependent receptor [Acidobacteriota bacterium]